MSRIIKRERDSGSSNSNSSEAEANDSDHDHVTDRRALRSRYHAVTNLIYEERDELTKVDSAKFNSVFKEVESLHQYVEKPREQVADAEALLGITKTLFTSVKATNCYGITIAEFVNSLLNDFSKQSGLRRVLLDWKKIGTEVSHVFKSSPGCQTMIGPMDKQIQQRKASVRRKRVRPTEKSQPAEVDDQGKQRTDTDGNMITMFNILRKKRKVRLEHLVLNRNSFAQTVENLFALSFLVKDGRAEINVEENGFHLVSPKNAPAARSVASREVVYNHFVFRLDFQDWKLMTDYVETGQELMPNRNQVDESGECHLDMLNRESEATEPTTPIRKLSRNRGLVSQIQSVVEDSPESNDRKQLRQASIREGKRKLGEM